MVNIKFIGFLVFCYGGVFVRFDPAEFRSLNPLRQVQELLNPSGAQVQEFELTDGFWLFRKHPRKRLALYRIENGHHTPIKPTKSLEGLVLDDPSTFCIYDEDVPYNNLCDFVDKIFATIEFKDTNGQILQNKISPESFFIDTHGYQIIDRIDYRCWAFSLDGKTIYMKQSDYLFYPLDERFWKLNPLQILHVLSGNTKYMPFVQFEDLKPGFAIIYREGYMPDYIRIPHENKSLDNLHDYMAKANDGKTTSMAEDLYIEDARIKFIDINTSEFVPSLTLRALLKEKPEWSWYATHRTGKIVYVKRACA